jgi:ABC-type cobalamin/Fe3+-siderophores transport system ATPase subunit
MRRAAPHTPARSNMCLAGDNGAGKSTLIKAISGVFHYDEGDIYLDGKRVARVAFATPQEVHKTPQCCRGHDCTPGDRGTWNRYETAGRVATEYFRFGKVDVVENVRPLKPKLFGNTHFWLET